MPTESSSRRNSVSGGRFDCERFDSITGEKIDGVATVAEGPFWSSTVSTELGDKMDFQEFTSVRKASAFSRGVLAFGWFFWQLRRSGGKETISGTRATPEDRRCRLMIARVRNAVKVGRIKQVILDLWFQGKQNLTGMSRKRLIFWICFFSMVACGMAACHRVLSNKDSLIFLWKRIQRIRRHGPTVGAIVSGLMMALQPLGMPMTPFEVAAGFCFGCIKGLLIGTVGKLSGSLLTFYIAHFFRSFVSALLSHFLVKDTYVPQLDDLAVIPPPLTETVGPTITDRPHRSSAVASPPPSALMEVSTGDLDKFSESDADSFGPHGREPADLPLPYPIKSTETIRTEDSLSSCVSASTHSSAALSLTGKRRQFTGSGDAIRIGVNNAREPGHLAVGRDVASSWAERFESRILTQDGSPPQNFFYKIASLALKIGRPDEGNVLSLTTDAGKLRLIRTIPAMADIVRGIDSAPYKYSMLLRSIMVPLAMKNYILALLGVRFVPYVVSMIVTSLPFSLLNAKIGSSTFGLFATIAEDGEVTMNEVMKRKKKAGRTGTDKAAILLEFLAMIASLILVVHAIRGMQKAMAAASTSTAVPGTLNNGGDTGKKDNASVPLCRDERKISWQSEKLIGSREALGDNGTTQTQAPPTGTFGRSVT